MKVSYTLTFNEFRKAQWHYRWGTTKNKILVSLRIVGEIILSVIFGGILGILIGFSWWTSHHPYASSTPGFAEFLITGTVVFFLFIRLLSFSRYRLSIWLAYRNSEIKDGQTITLLPEFLQSETKIRKSEFKWEAVTQIRSKSNLVTIFVGKGTAIIIPIRAFDSQEQKKNFLSLLDKYFNVSRSYGT